MFKSLSRLTQTRFNVNVTLLGASVGLLGATITTTSSDKPSPRRQSYKYLICGGGPAAHSALQTLLENNASDLLVVTPEWRSPTPPTLPQTLLSSLSALFTSAPEILVGSSVQSIDTTTRTATLADGTRINFQRCLLAVGAAMPEIPVGKVVSPDAAHLVTGAQSTDDRRRLERLTRDTPGTTHVTVVGGGWLAPVVGAGLIAEGAEVTFSYAEPSFLARYFPRYVGQDVLARLCYLADGGVDTLSYAAVRYIVARESGGRVEAEVHAGTVFDAFSIIDFRTDAVVFAPTLPTRVPVDVPNVVSDDGLVVNGELSVASDVYVAGAAMAVGKGGVGYGKGMRWSADHARATGRHAALNMLGRREVYAHTARLTVDLAAINLQVSVVGEVDGSKESFGYFQRGRARGDDTCGGAFERGVLFCVEPAPLSYRGAAQRLFVCGVAVWDGSRERGIQGLEGLLEEATQLVGCGGMARPQLEAAMDAFAERLDIRLFREDRSVRMRAANGGEDVVDGEDVTNGEAGTRTETRKPSPGVVWRRHRSARAVGIREDELLWVENDWVGAASPNTKVDNMAEAYAQLLKGAARRE